MDHPVVSDLADKPTLVGERVLLRPVVERDVAGLWEIVNDPDGRRLTGTHTEFTQDELRRWYASRGQHADRLDLAVVERVSGQYAGEAVLNDLDAANGSCSFRIALRPAFRGRGLGTEATELLLAHGFQTVGLHRISLEVYTFNPRARAVYERVGFRAEGVLRDALYWEGTYVDATVMSMLAPEWNHRHAPPA
jgi:RimJ/RimL family protein N-acetyltransferase